MHSWLRILLLAFVALVAATVGDGSGARASVGASWATASCVHVEHEASKEFRCRSEGAALGTQPKTHVRSALHASRGGPEVSLDDDEHDDDDSAGLTGESLVRPPVLEVPSAIDEEARAPTSLASSGLGPSSGHGGPADQPPRA